VIYNPYIPFVRVELKVRPFLPSTIIISHCDTIVKFFAY
jgi:hypothetical protein